MRKYEIGYPKVVVGCLFLLLFIPLLAWGKNVNTHYSTWNGIDLTDETPIYSSFDDPDPSSCSPNCQCDPCQCDPCQCDSGCQCNPCQCNPCQCGTEGYDDGYGYDVQYYDDSCNLPPPQDRYVDYKPWEHGGDPGLYCLPGTRCRYICPNRPEGNKLYNIWSKEVHMRRNPAEYNAANWKTIMLHMRLLIPMPACHYRKIVSFLRGEPYVNPVEVEK